MNPLNGCEGFRWRCGCVVGGSDGIDLRRELLRAGRKENEYTCIRLEEGIVATESECDRRHIQAELSSCRRPEDEELKSSCDKDRYAHRRDSVRWEVRQLSVRRRWNRRLTSSQRRSSDAFSENRYRAVDPFQNHDLRGSSQQAAEKKENDAHVAGTRHQEQASRVVLGVDVEDP